MNQYNNSEIDGSSTLSCRTSIDYASFDSCQRLVVE